MRVACQAADASHPKGAEQARREQGNLAGQVILWQTAGGESFIGRATPEKGAGRTVTIQTTEWSSTFRLQYAQRANRAFHRGPKNSDAKSEPTPPMGSDDRRETLASAGIPVKILKRQCTAAD